MLVSVLALCCWRWLPLPAQRPAVRSQRRGKGARGRPGQRHPRPAGQPAPAAGCAASSTLEDKVRGLTQSLCQATGTNEELQPPDSDSRTTRSTRCRRISPIGSAPCRRSSWAPAISHELRRGRHARRPVRAAAAQAQHAPGDALAADRQPPTIDAAALARSCACRAGHRCGGRRPALWAPAIGPATAAAERRAGGSPAQYRPGDEPAGQAQYAEAARRSAPMPTPIPTTPTCRPRRSIGWATSPSSSRIIPARRAPSPKQIKKYPKSPRAPDAMLKLGQSCMAHGPEIGRLHHPWPLIKTKYPNASPSTLAAAAGARKAACSK